MKKRFKVLIGVAAFCTVAGLFTSLVFCALSSFPELLEAEGQNKEEAAVESFDVATNYFHNAEPENNEVASVGVGGGESFTPSNYDAYDTAVVSPTIVKESEKTIVEVSTAKESVQVNRGKEHFSGFYEYRDEVVISKEKAGVIYLEKDEDNNKILECTLLVIVIVQALGFVILQSKNKEPQIECLENRENHLD